MRVTFVTTSFPRFSGDHYVRFVFEQARALVRYEGCQVVVVAPHAPGLVEHEVMDGVDVHRVRYAIRSSRQRIAYRHEGLFETLRRTPSSLVQLPGLLLALSRGAWKYSAGAHLIHAHWTPTAMAAAPAARFRGLPLVVSARGADVNTARGSRLGRLLTRGAMQRCSAVLTVSLDFAVYLREDLRVTSSVEALFNGVDAEVFRPRSMARAREALGLADGRWLMFTGGLIRRKGVDVLLRAFHELSTSMTDLRLVIAGEGPLQEVLEEQARSGPGASRVRFLGALGSEEVATWLNAVDALVLPSHSEGRPNVVLEALASGTPVVASDLPGTRELIEEGVTGLLVPAGDVPPLTRALEALLTQPELAERLGRGGPAFIQKAELSWEAHAHALAHTYRRALAGS